MLCKTHWSGVRPALLGSVVTNEGSVKANLLSGDNIESLCKIGSCLQIRPATLAAEVTLLWRGSSKVVAALQLKMRILAYF